MINQIESVRQDILKYFDKNNLIENSEICEISDSGLYYYTSCQYRQNDPTRNWVICKIQIWETESNNIIYEYLTDSDDNYHCACWITKDKNEYLFLPEAYQGQSVFSIKERKLYSFYSKEDPFIWQKIHLTDDVNTIVVEGCYWACPTEFRTYNISEIISLPYLIINIENKLPNS